MASTNKLPEGSTWEKLKLNNVLEDTTVTVTFAEDKNHNDIPDKYETVTVSAVAGEGGSVSPSKKQITAGESTEIDITPEEGYVVDTIIVGDTTYVNNPNFNKAFVESTADLTAALADETKDTVEVNGNLAVASETQINKPITINGNGNVITDSSTGKTFTLTKDSEVNDIVIENTADNTLWHSTYGLQFYTGTHVVENAKISGGNAAIIVNSADVTLKGTIDISGNTFGGIEVSKGSAEGLTAGKLDITGATLINTTEEYGKPSIWIDGNTDDEGIVVGANSMTMVEVDHDGTMQKQFYLVAENAVAPEATE